MVSIPNSLPDLARALRTGALAVADYLEQLEARFAEREPTILAFVPEENRFERLRREAEALVARYPRFESRPALFGVPLGVKDIFHVAGFVTHAGSRLPPEVLQGTEAVCVAQLKDAGALILGKTVTTEFAYFAPGPTRNPRSPVGETHTPGGSSSGSAAAVAAGLCPLALGTQTIGSIVRPASFCGVVGFKPSYGRISRDGVIPLSPSLDHVGVFAADVNGLSLAVQTWLPRDEAARSNIKPVLGIPKGPYLDQASAEMLAHYHAVCDRLARAGYVVKSVNAMLDFDSVRERHYLITAAEASRVHKEWYPRFRDLYHPKTIELLERGLNISSESLADALTGRERLRAELTELMDAHHIDLWISPAAPGPAPKGLESTGNPIMNLPWTHAGLPALSVPCNNKSEGLPMGLQLTGRWHADEALLAWAIGIEDVTRDM